jgi:hypothetical protein
MKSSTFPILMFFIVSVIFAIGGNYSASIMSFVCIVLALVEASTHKQLMEQVQSHNDTLDILVKYKDFYEYVMSEIGKRSTKEDIGEIEIGDNVDVRV